MLGSPMSRKSALSPKRNSHDGSAGKTPMIRPSYKTLVNALDAVLGINTSHDGNPPSWDRSCKKCEVVRIAKDVLERAKRKPKKAKSK